ncbi:MAG: hypothetical protein K2L21_00460 [Muribaculaceae bacterium]|nr:hypothetical protein [Muribaculaceae bacterium]
MELLVTISLSDQLFELLEDKLPNLGRRMEKAITKTLSAQVRRESNMRVEVAPGGQAPQTADAAPATTAAAEAPMAEAPATENAAEASDKAPTLEDCRAAVKRARLRIEGEGYENKTGEGYDKYHKEITAQIKQIVMAVSGGAANKIPDLTEDRRGAFIAMCDTLVVGADGHVEQGDLPF